MRAAATSSSVPSSGRMVAFTSRVLLLVGVVVSFTIFSAQRQASRQSIASTSQQDNIPHQFSALSNTPVINSNMIRKSPPRQPGTETTLVLDSLVQTTSETPTMDQTHAVPEAVGVTGPAAKAKVTVLVWNNINGYVDWLRRDFLNDAKTHCSTECHFTSDRSQLQNADGVLFHGPNHSPGDFPRSKPSGQKWIFMSLEQPHYFGDPSLLRNEDYRNRFDYTSTYELDSSIPITCIHPHWDADYYHTLTPASFSEKDGFGSPGAGVMFTSNCKNAGAEKRLQYLSELMQYMDVHSYGKCLHNRDEPPAAAGVSRAVNKQRVLRRYKFYFAFENNVIRDYVSEKVFDGLLSGSLPVYWGTSSVDKYMPSEHAVIKALDFKDPRELAGYLKTVASNETLYNSFFAWKSNRPSEDFRRVLASTAYKYTSMCNICHRLASDKGKAATSIDRLMDFKEGISRLEGDQLTHDGDLGHKPTEVFGVVVRKRPGGRGRHYTLTDKTRWV